MIIGVDEVGLGAWAGPLTVCAFAAPGEQWALEGLNDSKALSRMARTRIAKKLQQEHAQCFEVVNVSSAEIDRSGIGRVLPRAMEQAIYQLIARVGLPDRVIIDGESKGFHGAEYVPKADALFPCVMAASILAKVQRDAFMEYKAVIYPEYGFEAHAGYGTKRHRNAIALHGICPLHRRSYRPMCDLVCANPVD